MKHQLHGLKGNAYTAKKQQLFQELLPVLCLECKAEIDRVAQVTPSFFASLAVKYKLPFKVIFEFFEDCGLLPQETYESLGVKPQDFGVMW